MKGLRDSLQYYVGERGILIQGICSIISSL